ncbi:DUF4974 domain-containing protein [Flavobacteriaceae bacterium F89]|uniref:DUF4974 domain-containing protein n=1 Tax=Cerina litoralis TaxID=2874477 RepID=A0AAE3JQ34_9FLAO|nr:FecR domain-containing protein [Cerina litoralis]MCG2461686.1 DUF4974 domain-containing protein [Cerina litoralis]
MEFKIILKKINSTLNEEEEAIFKEWYDESSIHRAYFKQVEENFQEAPETLDIDIKNSWRQLQKRITPRKKWYSYWRYAAAAAVILLVASTLFFIDKQQSSNTNFVPATVDNTTIEIGTDKATLTLEDGSNVVLEKGKSYEADHLKSNGEKLIYKTLPESNKNEVAYNVLTIPRGGQFFIELSDGTKVWLNSESQLRYPVAFVDGVSRKVELVYGEAYFEVSHSTEHQGANFVVATQDQEVTVLGTEFNIKAYKEDAFIATTLVEGKVLVNNENTTSQLSPGHQAMYDAGANTIDIIPVDVYNEISWKNGFFSFKNKSLKDIMTVLSRWYDIKVVFKNQNVENKTFNGVFSKKQELSDILSIIENTNEAKFEINGKIIIMK